MQYIVIENACFIVHIIDLNTPTRCFDTQTHTYVFASVFVCVWKCKAHHFVFCFRHSQLLDKFIFYASDVIKRQDGKKEKIYHRFESIYLNVFRFLKSRQNGKIGNSQIPIKICMHECVHVLDWFFSVCSCAVCHFIVAIFPFLNSITMYDMRLWNT